MRRLALLKTTVRSRGLVLPIVAGLMAIAGPVVPAGAEPAWCTIEGRGGLASRDSFHGDVLLVTTVGGVDASGSWFHVSPSAGASLVNVTLEDGHCAINGEAHGALSGTGRWRNQPVEFEVEVVDSIFGDTYEITISTPGGDTVYHAAGPLVRGDITVESS